MFKPIAITEKKTEIQTTSAELNKISCLTNKANLFKQNDQIGPDISA